MSLARRRLPVVLVVLGLAAALFLALLSPIGASSHREAPLITEDPVADNTDVYAWMKGDNTGGGGQLDPARGAGRRPELLQVRRRRALRDQHRQRRRRRGRRHYEFRFTTKIKNPNTFLYNTGPIESLDDADWNMRPDLHRVGGRERPVGPSWATGSPSPPTTSAQGRPPTTRAWRLRPSTASPAGSRSSPVSATSCSRSTWGRSSTWAVCGRSTSSTSCRSTPSPGWTPRQGTTCTPS